MIQLVTVPNGMHVDVVRSRPFLALLGPYASGYWVMACPAMPLGIHLSHAGLTSLERRA